MAINFPNNPVDGTIHRDASNNIAYVYRAVNDSWFLQPLALNSIGGAGTVTAVAAVGTRGVTVVGSPITTAGTLTLGLSVDTLPAVTLPTLATDVVLITRGTTNNRITLGNLRTFFDIKTNLGYIAGVSNGTVTSSTGDSAIIPLFSTTRAGLVRGTSSNIVNFLRADGTWATPQGVARTYALDDLTDVSISNPATGQGVVYNGKSWVNTNVPIVSSNPNLKVSPAGVDTPVDPLKGNPFRLLSQAITWARLNLIGVNRVNIDVAAGDYLEPAAFTLGLSTTKVNISGATSAPSIIDDNATQGGAFVTIVGTVSLTSISFEGNAKRTSTILVSDSNVFTATNTQITANSASNNLALDVRSGRFIFGRGVAIIGWLRTEVDVHSGTTNGTVLTIDCDGNISPSIIFTGTASLGWGVSNARISLIGEAPTVEVQTQEGIDTSVSRWLGNPVFRYTIPQVATTATLGRVRIGSGISVAADGTISTAGASGAVTLDGLTDVTISNPQNSQFLTYNSATRQWINSASTNDNPTNLDALTDVKINNPVLNNILRFNGTTWVNSTEQSTGTITSITPGAGIVGTTAITTTGTIDIGSASGSGIRVNPNDISIDRTVTDSWYVAAAHVGSTGAAHGRASASVDGFMSSVDKVKLDGFGPASTYLRNSGDIMSGPLIVTTNNVAAALRVTQTGPGDCLIVEDSANPDPSPFVIDFEGNVVIGIPKKKTIYRRIDNTLMSGKLQIEGTGPSLNSIVLAQVGTGGVGDCPILLGARKSAGVYLTNNQYIFGLVGNGSGTDGTFYQSARFTFVADGNHADNSYPGKILFQTTPTGLTVPRIVATITQAGHLELNATLKQNIAGINHRRVTLANLAIGASVPIVLTDYYDGVNLCSGKIRIHVSGSNQLNAQLFEITFLQAPSVAAPGVTPAPSISFTKVLGIGSGTTAANYLNFTAATPGTINVTNTATATMVWVMDIQIMGS